VGVTDEAEAEEAEAEEEPVMLLVKDSEAPLAVDDTVFLVVFAELERLNPEDRLEE
jgi:hypothetical protein